MDAQFQIARQSYDLGSEAKTRYLNSELRTDLNAAIQHYRAALEACPKTCRSFTLQKCLTGLAQAYYYRFHIRQKRSDIDEAVHYAKGALSIIKPSSDRLRYQVLSNFATYLSARYQWTNDQRDLELGLDYSRQALYVVPDGHSARPQMVQNVVSALTDYYMLSSHLRYLKEAIKLEEELLSGVQEESAIWSGCRSDYGTCLWLLFQRTLHKEHLKSAIEQTQQALAHPPDENEEKYVYMRNLAVYCAEAFDRGMSTDLSIALDHAHNACESKLTSSLQRSAWGCLAAIYALKSKGARDVSDIDQAILWVRKLIIFLPEDHPKQTRHRSNLGTYYLSRYDISRSKKDLQNGLSSLRRACSNTRSPPLDRLIACTETLKCYEDHEDWQSAAQISDLAFEILPNVMPLTNSRMDLQHVIQQVNQLSEFIPSILLKAGRSATEALQALEGTRNFISNLTLDMNFDCPQLEKRDKELWQRYKDCRERVRKSQSESEGNSREEDQTYTYSFNEELEQIRDEVRKLEGMERFLLPMLEQDITDLAGDGYIVSFNAGRFGSDAFVITNKAIHVVNLPALTMEFVDAALDVIAVKGYRGKRLPLPCSDSDTEEEMRDDISERQPVKFYTIRDMLDQLWVVAVKPVLDSLHLRPQKPSSSDLPNICWAASGAVMLLPLHAAGCHDRGSNENTLSYAVSSYTTSLKMLQRNQGQGRALDKATRPEIMVVSMPITPGEYRDLKAAEEADAVVQGTRLWADCDVLTQPGKQDVLDAFSTSSIVHFACHGTVHPFRPDKSCLILGRGSKETLSIEDLARVTRPRSKIAYLSACSTAESRAPKMENESIHLASTFQLIGFDNVIASLWAVDDDTAVSLAAKFYDIIAPGDLDKKSAVSRRLHDALFALREEMRHTVTGVVDLTSWAPFVCYGT